MDGCNLLLPQIKEEYILNEELENIKNQLKPISGIDYEITMPDGSNVKQFVVEIISELQQVMLKNVEDYTECFQLLLEVKKKLFFLFINT